MSGVHGFAKELVGLAPDVLFTSSTPISAALWRETRSIPIVFAQVSDPIGEGFVASLARPGGHMTGLTNFEPSMGGITSVQRNRGRLLLTKVVE
jgi:putative tryptophan/tyrosine transport system substrate-binding protein